MRISWNRSMNGDPRMAKLTIANERHTVCVEEDMTVEMIRGYAEELKMAADAVEKRLKRHESLMLIENLIKDNRRIDAIKELRTLMGLDLLNAKDIIEMMCAFKNGSN
jgi:ribosomal protein L7/L12